MQMLKQTHKARNINMRIQFIRECINNGLIVLLLIRSEDDVADVLTKPLDKLTFYLMVSVVTLIIYLITLYNMLMCAMPSMLMSPM
jgi:hypothetical protein